MLYIDAETATGRLADAPIFALAGEAFRLQSRGQVDQPLRAIVEGEGGLLGSMPASIKAGVYAGLGLKCVIVDFAGGHDRPSHRGVVLVDGERGTTGLAAVDAGAITQIRTAAASGYATQVLARDDARTLAILGTGLQARAHADAMIRVRPIVDVRIWGRDRDRADAFASWCRARHGLEARAFPTPSEAVRGSDVVCTVTSAREPFLFARDLPPNCHVNAVGASAPAFQELHEDVYAHVSLYTDSSDAVFAASRCVAEAARQGWIEEPNAATEVGAIDEPLGPRRTGITLFKSVGLAVQDLVFAREVIRRGFGSG